MRILAICCALFLVASAASATTLVYIPLDQQIDIGLGEAITDHSSFGVDAGEGYVRVDLTLDNGGGSYYYGPMIDLAKAGYGPYVDMSVAGTQIEYTARCFQGDGNTNPYNDCNVMMKIFDVSGREWRLGMSYGPRPDPHYPAWIICSDSASEGEGDPAFDRTKVVRIGFYGTDWAGVGNDFVEIRDLRITDPVVHNPIPTGEVKTREDGRPVEVDGIVTAAFPNHGCFYVEEANRTSGIQVRCSDLPSAGMRVYVPGTVQTDSQTGEMFIACDEWSRNQTGSVTPLCLNSRSLGGGGLARQCGVENGQGLNNVGLLVRLAGTVVSRADDFSEARVSDGGDTGEGGVYIDLSGIPYWQRPTITEGQSVIVTGISSIYTGNDAYRQRMIRVGSAAGIVDAENPGNEPKTVRVAVINFDPFCPGYGGGRTHEVCGFNDPHANAEGYIDDLMQTSGNFARCQVVSWYDADYYPYFEDGFRYSPDDWVYAWDHRDTDPMHSGVADYPRMLTDASYPHNQPSTIAERIANDEIDEVFLFGAQGWEAAMAGPSPFFVNGGTYLVPEAGRNFVIMGFSYERGVDCMLEDFCHRTECTMSQVYPSPDWWLPTYPPTNNWEAFRMYDQRGPDHAACGICHFAPNSESDYDWGNTNYVWSTCDDWLYNWPNLAGDITRRWVNCEEWGDGNMRLHHVWWLDHLPKAQGINPDSRQNNWWKYVLDFNSYPESR